MTSADLPADAGLRRPVEPSTLAACPALLVATDFDGVLAPLRRGPLTPAPLPGTIETLRALADLPGVHVAVVSGRDLATLRASPDLARTSHGHSSAATAPTSTPTCDSDGARRSSTRDDDADAADRRRRDPRRTATPGPASSTSAAAVVVHTRGLTRDAPRPPSPDARAVALERAGRQGAQGQVGARAVGLARRQGHALIGARPQRRRDAALYFGDDVTDEDAFRRDATPRDVTVKVGAGRRPRATGVDDERDAVARRLLASPAQLLAGAAADTCRAERAAPAREASRTAATQRA